MITKCSKFGDYYYYYFPPFCRLKTLKITYSYFLISPVRKNAASEVLVVELNTMSEKGYTRPGKEICTIHYSFLQPHTCSAATIMLVRS